MPERVSLLDPVRFWREASAMGVTHLNLVAFADTAAVARSGGWPDAARCAASCWAGSGCRSICRGALSRRWAHVPYSTCTAQPKQRWMPPVAGWNCRWSATIFRSGGHCPVAACASSMKISPVCRSASRASCLSAVPDWHRATSACPRQQRKRFVPRSLRPSGRAPLSYRRFRPPVCRRADQLRWPRRRSGQDSRSPP